MYPLQISPIVFLSSVFSISIILSIFSFFFLFFFFCRFICKYYKEVSESSFEGTKTCRGRLWLLMPVDTSTYR